MKQIDAFEDLKKMEEFTPEKQKQTLDQAIKALQKKTRELKKMLKQLSTIEDKKSCILKTCQDLSHD